MKQVDFKIIANKLDITYLIKDRLMRLTLSDSAGIENDTAEIELDNRDQAISPPATGAELDIYIGYEGALVFKGTYTVDEISEPLEIDTLTISAQAARMKGAFKAPRDSSYDEITLGELAQKIGARHGYEVKIEPSISSIHFTHLDQRAESDSNLLTRLARENGAIFKIAANILLLVPKQRGKAASGAALSIIEINDSENSKGNITILDRDDYQSALAYWFDEDGQEKKGERAGIGEPEFIIRKTHADKSAALNAATSKLQSLQRGKASLNIMRPLNPLIIAEGFLQISNHKKNANGRWLVENVTHVIEPGSVAKTTSKCSVI